MGSAFRFSPTSRRGEYLVSRAGTDERIGWVVKVTMRAAGMTATGYTRSERTIWEPTTNSRKTLATEPTREAAARALWVGRQRP